MSTAVGWLRLLCAVTVLCGALAGCVPSTGGGPSVRDLDRDWIAATDRLDAALTELHGDIGLQPPGGQALLPWFERELPRLSAATDSLSAAYREWRNVTDEVLSTGIEIRDASGTRPIDPASIREFGSAVEALVAGYEQQRDLVGGCVSLAEGNEGVFTGCFLEVVAEHGEAWHRNGLHVMDAMANLLGDPQAQIPDRSPVS